MSPLTALAEVRVPVSQCPLTALAEVWVLVVLGAYEVGQDVPEAPAGVPQPLPLVVVVLVASDVHHAVDARAAAQHLTAVQRALLQ